MAGGWVGGWWLRVVLVCWCVVVLGCGVFVPVAFGGSAWWHVVSGARPTYLHSLGVHGVNGVQDVTVTGEVGMFYALADMPASQSAGCVEDGECENAAGEFLVGESFEVGESAGAFQAKLEKVGGYGAHSVQVTGGPVGIVVPGETITSTYRVTFTGPRGEQPVELINTEVNALFISDFGLELAGVTSSVVVPGSLGHPDGTIVASAFNLGDGPARECVRVVGAAGKFKDAGCTEAAVAGHEEYEREPLVMVDRLPAGLRAVGVEGGGYVDGARFVPISCVLEGEPAEVVVCRVTGSGSGFGGVVPPFQAIEVRVAVAVEAGAATGELNEVGISGAGTRAVSVQRPITISGAPVPFGVEDFEVTPEEEGGGVDTQAGSHPFQTTFTLNANETKQTVAAGSQLVTGNSAGLPRDVSVRFPPGLIGNPQPLTRCTSAQFLAEVNKCPAASVVGVAISTVNEPSHLGIISFSTPVFNLEPSAGEPARFGFLPNNRETPVYINASVRSGGDYGINAEVHDITQTIAFLSNVVTIWGVPGRAEHNETRDGCLTSVPASQYPGCEAFSESNPPAFFELPTSCSGVPLQASVELDSWEEPGVFKSVGPSVALPTLDGCNRLPFDPSIEVHPDVPDTSTATGLTVNVKVPQEESLNANGLGEADIRDTTVTLPEGVAINPSGGDGLEACPDALIGYEPEGSHPPGELRFTPRLPGSIPAVQAGEPAPFQPGVNFCSNASKIGTVRVTTPVLGHALEGAVYLAPQEANPFGSLVAMYIVAEDPESGVLLKLPGEVSLNPVTGQIVSTFLNTPQAPAEEIELHFFGGERAPLATPQACGTYTTTTSITPWSAPQSGPPATPSSSFQITSGPNGSACPGQGLPFAPSATAGSTNTQAGGYTPFTTTISREDGNQHLQAVQLKMPPGFTGLLSGVELCPEPQADEGLCGPKSLIGETTVSVGVGGDPFSVKGGRVYITGPFNGTGACAVGSSGCAPYGLSIVNPAKAGPYDLANTQNNHPPCDCVLVRAKIEVNPITAALTVTTDSSGPYQIPTILEGIPLQIKHVNVLINRPSFSLNPTNCNQLEITAGLTSAEGANALLSIPFQATNCATLKFTPKIMVSTVGHASKLDGASLHFKISYPTGAVGTQSWISEAKFDLPKQLPARLETLQRACLSTVFETNRGNCPKASIIGQAIVHTQVLPVPLKGPVYFVSYGSQKFPEAVIVLEGYGVTIDLHGETYINKKTGVTSATFRNTPDVPFENIEVNIPTGRYSEFGANVPAKDYYNLCSQKLQMPTLFKAQNGQQINQTTPITITGCKKPKHKPKHKTTHKHTHKR